MKRVLGACLLLVASAVIGSACSLDATQGAGGSSGPTGSVGSSCTCPASQKECDGSNGGCQPGLICTSGDVSSSQQVCTQACPCPLNFVCKAVTHLGGRLLCFKE